MPPSFHSVDNVARVEDLQDRRQKSGGEGLEEDHIGQAVDSVEVVSDDFVDDERHRDRVDKHCQNGLHSNTGLLASVGDVSLHFGRPIYYFCIENSIPVSI